MKALYECHGHIFMDGQDYRQARNEHKDGVRTDRIRQHLGHLQRAGVVYFRDGGDGFGVSQAARLLANEYGIEYATPVFAIHRKGYYGSIVGKGYETMDEFAALVAKAVEQGADFIKIMFSGILTFAGESALSCPSLPADEIRQLVHIVHDAGMAVMAHVNGREAVLAAAEAGTDSIEHGYFADEAALHAMADNHCIWVPTLAAVAAFTERDGFDTQRVRDVLGEQLRSVEAAHRLGVAVASGSDSGAVGVPHGGGIKKERELLSAAGIPVEAMEDANKLLKARFCRA